MKVTGIPSTLLLCKSDNVRKSRRLRSRDRVSPWNGDGKGRIAGADKPEHSVSAWPQDGGGTAPEAGGDHGEGAFIWRTLKRTFVDHPRAVKLGLGAPQGTSQQRTGYYAESRVVEWVFEQLRVRGVVSKQDLVDGSAQVAHVSPSTTVRYMDKLCSSEGPLSETQNEFGDLVVSLKESPVPMSDDGCEGDRKGV